MKHSWEMGCVCWWERNDCPKEPEFFIEWLDITHSYRGFCPKHYKHWVGGNQQFRVYSKAEIKMLMALK